MLHLRTSAVALDARNAVAMQSSRSSQAESAQHVVQLPTLAGEASPPHKRALSQGKCWQAGGLHATMCKQGANLEVGKLVLHTALFLKLAVGKLAFGGEIQLDDLIRVAHWYGMMEPACSSYPGCCM